MITCVCVTPRLCIPHQHTNVHREDTVLAIKELEKEHMTILVSVTHYGSWMGGGMGVEDRPPQPYPPCNVEQNVSLTNITTLLFPQQQHANHHASNTLLTTTESTPHSAVPPKHVAPQPTTTHAMCSCAAIPAYRFPAWLRNTLPGRMQHHPR